MTKRLHLRGALAAAVIALVALTGCQAVPDAGPVQPGLTELSQGDRQVRFNPNGPAVDADAQEIVRGFINAASSNADNYAVAREFLTPSYSEQWDPSAGVLVDEGTRPYREEEGNVSVLSLSTIADVDEHGVMTAAAPSPTIDVRFELEEQDGQWRISSAPTGVILERTTFEQTWTRQELFFLNQRGALVPDSRWFLNRPSLASEIVEELLEGPMAPYRDTLHTAFPGGTRLANGSVPIIEGTAEIALSAELAEASEATLEDVSRQLTATLDGVSGVTDYDLSAGNLNIGSRDVEAPEIDQEPQATIVERNGGFGVLSGGDVDPLNTLEEPVVDLDAEAVSVASTLQGAAVLSERGVSWVDDTGVALIDARAGQIAPVIDEFGYVWTYASRGPDGLVVRIPGEDGVSITAPWGAGRTPVAIGLSPSGSRIAALVADEENSVLLVAPVTRDDDGRPTGLGDTAVQELWTSGAPVDFDWVDEQMFAVLSRVGEGGKVTFGGPGQLITETGSVPGGVHISSGGARTQVRVLDENGDLYALQGQAWQRQERERGIDVLAKVG